jgi:predicted transposase YdaD
LDCAFFNFANEVVFSQGQTLIYQQAKEDNKLEIAHKLLAKGLTIQEVAEIVELDVERLK